MKEKESLGSISTSVWFGSCLSGTQTGSQFPHQSGSETASPGLKLVLKTTLWGIRMEHLWESLEK